MTAVTLVCSADNGLIACIFSDFVDVDVDIVLARAYLRGESGNHVPPNDETVIARKHFIGCYTGDLEMYMSYWYV